MNGTFELVSGERRLRAAKLAGLRSVPCILINATEERSQVIALIENIQRCDLNFFEEAEAISQLITKYGMTQESAAIRLGLAQSTVANKLRILKLNAEERKIILDNNMSERPLKDVRLFSEFLLYDAKRDHENRIYYKAIGKAGRIKCSTWNKKKLEVKVCQIFYISLFPNRCIPRFLTL